MSFFGAFAFFILFLSGAHGKEIVRITTGEWPPYTSRDLDGFGVLAQIVTEAMALEGYRVEYGFFPWKRSYELVKSGDWDGSIAWQQTELRKLEFYFSDAIISSPKVFFHRKDFLFDWHEFKDLEGLRIGITRGYAYTPTFRQDAEKHGLLLIEDDSDLVNLKLLFKGRIDLHPNDIRVGLHMIQNHFTPEEKRMLTYHPKAFFNAELSAIFPRTLPGRLRVEALNRGLKQLKESGRYLEILSSTPEYCRIIVGLSHWPPWKIIDGVKFGGIDVDVLKAVGKRIGFTFEFMDGPWKRCVEWAKHGRIAMITSFAKTPEREKFAHYLGPPYRTEKVVFYKKKGMPFQVCDFEDLYGLKIGTIKGAAYFKRFNSDPRLEKEIVATDRQLPQMLSTGRIDLMAGHEKTMDYFIMSEGLQNEFEKMQYRVSGLPAFIAFSKKSVAWGCRERIEAEICRMVENGEVERIVDAFFDKLTTASPLEK